MELDKQSVAQKVREYLQNNHPGGVTLEVVENDIHQVDYWWRIPVRPSAWPLKRYEYYEALADIESDIQEKEHLNILIAMGEPLEAEAA